MAFELFATLFSIGSMFLAIMILDYIWLGIVTKQFLIRQFASLVKVENGSLQINLVAGIATWFIIAVGCFVFAVNPATSLSNATLIGALFGFITYCIYDLTNLTFIVAYPKKFIPVDIAWGTILCAAISAIGFFVAHI